MYIILHAQTSKEVKPSVGKRNFRRKHITQSSEGVYVCVRFMRIMAVPLSGLTKIFITWEIYLILFEKCNEILEQNHCND